MTPYYEQDGITIYHGDCRELLPLLSADLLLTDPPYGIGRDGKPKSSSSHGGHKGYEFRGWDIAPPSGDDFVLMLSRCREFVIWGANYFAPFMPPGPGWLLWDKGQRIDQADGELAATSRTGPLRVFALNRSAIARDGAVHPTQKPTALMRWCLSFYPSSRSVLDPYMGSGSTLVAAKQDGRTACGVEQDERYCEIAAKRLSQGVLPLESTTTVTDGTGVVVPYRTLPLEMGA